MSNLITIIIGLPFVAALLLCFVPRDYRFVMRLAAIAATLLSMVLALVMFCGFDSAAAGPDGFKYVHELTWWGVSSLGIHYHVGVDGLNVGLLLMGAIVAFAAACCAWEIKTREKEFYILLLVMIGGVLGAFASLDIFFFYFFHELALVPTFIMIGVWGRGENKNYATFQMTIYLSIGALISLTGLIALYLKSGAHTFNMVEMTNYVREHPLSLSDQNFIFPLLLFGFGILISLWPFHTWAPLGYGSAPTPTAMLHAGVLKKFGLYGLIRLALPLLPQAAGHWANIIAWLCLGNIAYCGLVAMRQKDFSRLVGYSSVAHMGFVFLGIASMNLIGLTGAVLVMIAHGFLAALTFGLGGYVYQQTGTLEMSRLGGLLRRLPFVGAVLIMATFAGCGLPGFANFAGESTVFFGAYHQFNLITVIALWAALVIGAVYMLRAVRGILHGSVASECSAVAESSWPLRNIPYLVLLISLLVFGFFPQLLVDKIKPVTGQIAEATAGADLKLTGIPPVHVAESLPR
jgi:NADH-quinone oxidoreductase subunit M